MSSRPHLSPGDRLALAFFVLLFAATMWPIYPLFSTIRPFVLGMPFSLFYLVLLLVLGFVVLLGLFVQDVRNGMDE